jgi:hypothetical protein
MGMNRLVVADFDGGANADRWDILGDIDREATKLIA